MKQLSLTILTAVGLTALMSNTPAALAQEFQHEQWNQEYRSEYDVPPGKYYTGRSPFMRQREAAPAPAWKPAAPPTRRAS